MLVFSEGVPGSGKSYDAVKHHILPGLKAGRHVFARLNGLKNDRIAEHLQIPIEQVNALLHHVATNEVVDLFVADQDDSGDWHIADQFLNALVVIDEVHDFYIGGTRAPMDKRSEQFFALHRHYGLDVLVMTQFYKRVHPALRSRIERKTTFQKLSALGKKGESLYRAKHYQTIAPDKYEHLAGETLSYDSAIYPLYKGVVASAVKTQVYDGGRVSVWRALRTKAIIIVPLGVFAIWYLLDFFSGGGAKLVKVPVRPTGYAAHALGPDQGEPIPGYVAPAKALPAAPAKAPAAVDERADFTPQQRYVWALSDDARVRLAAQVGTGADARAVVEWVDRSQVVKERLTARQLRDLGVIVTVHEYGLQLQAGEETLIATAWPLNAPLRDSQPRLYDTRGGGSAVSVSEPLTAAAATPLPVGEPVGIASGPQGAFRAP